MAAEVENDWRENVSKLAQAHDWSTKIVHAILHKDLKLSKKSGRWLPKLADKEMKNERVRVCEAFVAMIAVVPWQSWQHFHCWWVDRKYVKSELTDINLSEEVSSKGLGWGYEKSQGRGLRRDAPALLCLKCVKTAGGHIESS
jgi:hypothetical protein